MKYYEVDFSIDCPNDLRADVCDVVAALAGDAGFESFTDTPKGISGYVQQDVFDASLLDDMLTQLPFGDQVKVTYQVLPADEADWNAPWEKEGFEPVWVGDKLVIHDGTHLPPAATMASTDVISVEIDAKLAFGTGNHQTTRLMCQALMNLPLKGKSLLDCGTGTGILAIVALLRGARPVAAYDIDEWSAINAQHNAIINHVDGGITVWRGDSSVLQDMDDLFDVVVANINRNILLADLPLMKQHLNPNGGTLLLSGFYQADVPLLVARAEELGLHLQDQTEEGEWTLLQLQLNN